MTGVLADIGVGPISIPTPGDLVSALKNAVVEVADAVFDKIMEFIAGLLADTVAKVTEALVTLLAAIKPSITPGGAVENAEVIQQSVLGLAASLLAAFYLFRIIHGLVTGQTGQTVRATIVELPMVVVGTLFFGFLCYTLLSIIDAFSDPMIDEFATTLNETVTTLYSEEGLVKGGLFVFIFAILYIAAAIFLCIELFVRSSLIYLVVMFAPLALATRVWGPTRSHARRATEVAVALIFSKLAIAVTLATGASLMQGAAESGGNVEMIQGSAILLLAAFMPFALLRVIPVMEGAVSAEGMARGMGTKAAIAGYGASRVGDAISGSASSAGSSVRSRWDNRKSAIAEASPGDATDKAAGSSISDGTVATTVPTGQRSSSTGGRTQTTAPSATTGSSSGRPNRAVNDTGSPESTDEPTAPSSPPPASAARRSPTPASPGRRTIAPASKQPASNDESDTDDR
jgi:hypothetical protein